MRHAEGWAVCSGNQMYPETVGPTRRSAVVNWLWVFADVAILKNTTDEQIEMMWKALAPPLNVEVIEVRIEEKPHA